MCSLHGFGGVGLHLAFIPTHVLDPIIVNETILNISHPTSPYYLVSCVLGLDIQKCISL